MKNKRAFLLGEETLKIIIAVIAIGLLVFLLFKIYYGGKESEQLDQAQASLDHFISELDSGAEIIEIYNPENWYIASWPILGIYPERCGIEGGSCICICSNFGDGEDLSWGISQLLYLPVQTAANHCDEEGVCENYYREINVKPTVLEDLPKSFLVSDEEGVIVVGGKDGS